MSNTRALFLVLSLVLELLIPASFGLAGDRTFISVPVLAVTEQAGKKFGGIHYIAMQLDWLPQPIGPQIQFNEGSRALGRFVGGALSPDWKEAANVALAAASRSLQQDPRTWLITIKNASPAYLTDGPSASSILAVGIAAAVRGDSLLSGIALTGAIEGGGRIGPVGGLPEKIQGAAAAGFSTVLIPKGQSRTSSWDLISLAESLRLTVIEVQTLPEAYEKMTGRPLQPS